MDPNHECCIFCLTARGNITSKTCTYGFHHEFPTPAKVVQEKKIDKNICTTCKMHKKNPLYFASECSHTHPE